MPAQGVPAALGYADQSEKLELVYCKKSLCWETFIEPSQNIQKFRCKVKIKLNKKYSER